MKSLIFDRQDLESVMKESGDPSVLRKMGDAVWRAWYGAFIVQRWTMGLASGELGSSPNWIENGLLLNPLGGGDFLADPFVVPSTDGRVILCEWMQASRGRGVIARVEIDDRGRLLEIHKVIDWPPYHLSYPHVIVFDGRLYCTPEACHSRTVRLFELSTDARTVIDSREILSDFPAVDPTIFLHDGLWWLMCTTAKDGGSNSHLFAFYGDTPFGPWKPHNMNPIVVDVSRARPAGRVFSSNGVLYRPAQDCSIRYGGGLKLFAIQVLTPNEYVEELTWSIYPPVGVHGHHGIHTVNCADGQIVYDAYSERFSAFAWVYRLRERYR